MFTYDQTPYSSVMMDEYAPVTEFEYEKRDTCSKMILLLLLVALAGGAYFLFGTDTGASLIGGSGQSSTDSNSYSSHYSTRQEAISRIESIKGKHDGTSVGDYIIHNVSIVAYAYKWRFFQSRDVSNSSALTTIHKTYTTACPQSELQTGDLLSDGKDFVVIFNRWTKDDMSEYELYWVRNDQGIVDKAIFEYPYLTDSQGKPYKDVVPRCVRPGYFREEGSGEGNGDGPTGGDGGGTSNGDCNGLGSALTGWNCATNDDECFRRVVRECYEDSDWYSFETKLSANFSLGEIAQDHTNRLPTYVTYIPNGKKTSTSITLDIETARMRIVKIAHSAQIVRSAIQKQFNLSPTCGLSVTSGWRPYVAYKTDDDDFSRHKFGDAIDFAPSCVNAKSVERWLESHWEGGFGRGVDYKGFIHIDLRGNGRGFRPEGGCVEVKGKWDHWDY